MRAAQLDESKMEIPDKEPPPDLICKQPFKCPEVKQVKHFVGKPLQFLPRRQTAFQRDGFTAKIGGEKRPPARSYLSASLVVTPKELDMNHKLQLEELERYYENKQDFLRDVVLPFGTDSQPLGMSGISLRLINWTVTILAQLRSIVYYVDAEGQVSEDEPPTPHRKVELGNAYLQAISPPLCKVDFDPCKRHARILFPVKFRDEPLNTTLGQLNFFRWVNRIGLLKWMVPRTAELAQCMAEYKKMAMKRKHEQCEDGEEALYVMK